MTDSQLDVRERCISAIERCEDMITFLEGMHGKEVWNTSEDQLSITGATITMLAMQQAYKSVLAWLDGKEFDVNEDEEKGDEEC